FSISSWNRIRILNLARDLKSSGADPFLLAGGPDAGADSRRILSSGNFDALLRGEGEESFAELAQRLAEDRDLVGIEGLYTGEGQTLPTASSCSINQLTSPWLNNTLRPTDGGVLWEVARGCPFNCNFCYDAKGQAGVRPLPVARLAAELECFCDNGTEQVWILDSSFNAPPKRGHQLLQLLIDNAPQLHYHLEAKAEFIDRKTIKLLGQLSCSIQLGLQSANSTVLAGLNRKINPDKFWSGVELLANSGLTFGLDLIYGLPGDSYTGFCASLKQALDYRPNQLDIFPLAVLPGTRLFQQQQELTLKAEPHPPYLLIQSPDFSTSEMKACSLLAAATDIFYNLGRAVAFLLPCCESLQISPLNMLEAFRDWVIKNQGEETLLAPSALTPQTILQLQKDFLCQRFSSAHQQGRWPLVADILDYHYLYAETLLGPETLPAEHTPAQQQKLKLAEGVTLIDLRCEILGALEAEAIDLARWEQLVEQRSTSGLMIRRGSQVFTEVLTTEFAQLLRRAQKAQSRQQLCAGFPREEATELLNFALQEGLLIADAS
ncbi:MAG: radical SAM protein, partial [Geopsychrobacter sp.]|nr:radical SAM protein [Geopsychrobacter sp.]